MTSERQKVKPEEELIASFTPPSTAPEEKFVVPIAPPQGVKKEPVKIKTDGSAFVRERYKKLREQGFSMSTMSDVWQKKYQELRLANTAKKTSGESATTDEIRDLANLEFDLSQAMNEFEEGQEIKKQFARYESVDEVRRGITRLYSQMLREATGGKLDIQEQKLNSGLNAYLSRLPLGNPIEAGKFNEVVDRLSRIEARVKEKESRIIEEARAILPRAKIGTLDDVRERMPEMSEALNLEENPTDNTKRRLKEIEQGITKGKIDDAVSMHLSYERLRREILPMIIGMREVYQVLQAGLLNYFESYVSEYIAPLVPAERGKSAALLNVRLTQLVRRGLLQKEVIRKLQDKLDEMTRQATNKIFNNFKSVKSPNNLQRTEVRKNLGEAGSVATEKPRSGVLGKLVESGMTLLKRGEWYWRK